MSSLSMAGSGLRPESFLPSASKWRPAQGSPGIFDYFNIINILHQVFGPALSAHLLAISAF